MYIDIERMIYMENKIYEMPKGKYIFLWGGLIKDAGGMTRVMLDRLCQFKREGLKVIVLLGGRGKEQYDAAKIYQQSGYPEISENDFLCMEDWLEDKLTAEENIFFEEENNYIVTNKRENMQELYYQGELIGKKIFNCDNELAKIEYYNISSGIEKKIKSIDFYYHNKKYKRVNFVNEKEKNELYFAKNGFCYMTCSYNCGREVSAKLFDQKKKMVYEYASISEVREFFYSEYVMENYTEDLYVLCDPILDLEPGFRYMKEKDEHKLYKIAINHGIGFGEPKNWNSRCNPRFQKYLEPFSSELDALVILTDMSLKNINKRFGSRNIFKCIPNKIKINPYRCPVENRDKNKTVFAGRFSQEKRCVDIVKAFSYVVKQYPNAILELYGRGDTEKDIVQAIKENNLENNVFIKGFSRNIQEVFSQARLSVVTSEYTVESFCLSLVESLASGCPVVSYEMKFGAGYVIENGKNGYLSKPNDIKELADSICKVYEASDDELEKLSKNAYETAKIFSPEKYEYNWKKLMNEIIEQKSKRTNIKEMDVIIDRILCSATETKMPVVEGYINISGKIPKESEQYVRIYVRRYINAKEDYIIKEGEWLKEDENVYSFSIPIDKLGGDIGVCFECTNSFVEYDISKMIQEMIGF